MERHLLKQRGFPRAASAERNRIAHFDLSFILREAFALKISGGAARDAGQW
ncbi:hypothetical protein [Paraburkholderia sp. GAS348]|uniref:hypothetical protein n=1 Tax=Paraburkholderia sp. GAS348 TaxID=3035132 RepID=UPI003D22D4F0